MSILLILRADAMKNTQLLTSYASSIYRANDPKFYSGIDQPLANQMSKLGTHTLKMFSVVLPTRQMFKMCVGTFDEKMIKIGQNIITLAAFLHTRMVLKLGAWYILCIRCLRRYLKYI